MNYLPSQYRCVRPSDFIGPARLAAQRVEATISLAKQHGSAPIALLILGPPGIGKSQLADYFVRCVGVNPWCQHKFNGTSFRIEDVEELSRTVHFTNLFGDYRVLRLEEVDKVPTVAQVRMLTLLDDLPPGNAVVATSNCRLDQLEERFQRRFELLQLSPPCPDEVRALLLAHWPQLGEATANQIAVLTGGNVGAALKDATTQLTYAYAA